MHTLTKTLLAYAGRKHITHHAQLNFTLLLDDALQKAIDIRHGKFQGLHRFEF